MRSRLDRNRETYPIWGRALPILPAAPAVQGNPSEPDSESDPCHGHRENDQDRDRDGLEVEGEGAPELLIDLSNARRPFGFWPLEAQCLDEALQGTRVVVAFCQAQEGATVRADQQERV